MWKESLATRLRWNLLLLKEQILPREGDKTHLDKIRHLDTIGTMIQLVQYIRIRHEP